MCALKTLTLKGCLKAIACASIPFRLVPAIPRITQQGEKDERNAGVLRVVGSSRGDAAIYLYTYTYKNVYVIYIIYSEAYSLLLGRL